MHSIKTVGHINWKITSIYENLRGKTRYLSPFPKQPNASNPQRYQRRTRRCRRGRIAPKQKLNEAPVCKRRAPQLRESENMHSFVAHAAVNALQQRTWLLFFYLLRSAAQMSNSGKCKATKKNVPSGAAGADAPRERERINVREYERVRARARTRGGHLKLWEKLHKMRDALFLPTRCAAVKIFFVLLLAGDS